MCTYTHPHTKPSACFASCHIKTNDMTMMIKLLQKKKISVSRTASKYITDEWRMDMILQ